MDNKAIYTINPIGFTGQEKEVLNVILSLSQSREPTFRPFTLDGNNKPDILIIDFDDKQAVRQWQQLCIENIDYSSIPTIRITHKKTNDIANYYTSRPLTVTKILFLLEHLIAKEFNGRRPVHTQQAEVTDDR